MKAFHCLLNFARFYLWIQLFALLHLTALTQPFTPITNLFPSIYYGGTDWADINNDGLLDVVLAGEEQRSAARVHIFHQNPDHSFTNVQSLGGAFRSIPKFADFNGDGFLDLVVQTVSRSILFFVNDGHGKFSPRTQRVAGFWESRGFLECADLDNDGDVDLLLAGGEYTPAGSIPRTLIYHNDGKGNFFLSNASVPALSEAIGVVCDMDSDGDNDFFIDGAVISVREIFGGGQGTVSTKVDIYAEMQYSGHFLLSTNVGPFSHGAHLTWADINTNAFPDVLHTGRGGNFSYDSFLLERGVGGELFDISRSPFDGFEPGNAAFGDSNNDGRFDLAISGMRQANTIIPAARLFLWGTSGYVTNGTGIPSGEYKMFRWGDYDADGDLDILASTPYGPTSTHTVILRNEIAARSQPPSEPTRLMVSSKSANSVMLSWNPVQSISQSYNVRVGTSPGGIDIVSPMAAPLGGRRRAVQHGNASFAQRRLLRNLDAGTYYWSVQSISASFVGSSFALESSFTITNHLPRASPIEDKTIFPGRSLVVPLAISDVETPPELLQLRASVHDTNLSSAIQITGTGANRSLTFQTSGANAGVTEITLFITDPDGGVASQTFAVTVEPFTEAASIPLELRHVQWSDLNHDGALEVLGAQRSFRSIENQIRIHTLEDASTFSLTHTFSNYFARLGDFDQDSFMDLLLVGHSSSPELDDVRIFTNDHTGNFVHSQLVSSSPGFGYAALGDIDNDNDLDIMLLGRSANIATVIYRNDGPTWTLLAARFPPLPESRAGFIDYDQDGDQDLWLSGVSPYPSPQVAPRIYQNLDGANFAEQTPFSTNNLTGQLNWSDFDLDGDIDVISASTEVGDYARLTYMHLNDGIGRFRTPGTPLSILVPWYLRQRLWSAFGDYNGDGIPEILTSGGTPIFGTWLIQNVNDSQPVTLKISDRIPVEVGWIDLNNDGDLDFFGTSWGVVETFVNNTMIKHTGELLPPINLVARCNGSEALLEWEPHLSGLRNVTYNVRLGSLPGGHQIVSPLSNLRTGARFLPEGGNAGYARRWRIRNLPPGVYNWSVQSVSGNYEASVFAPGETFEIHPGASKWIRVSARPLALGFELAAEGPAGHRARFESSEDLLRWKPYKTNILDSGIFRTNWPNITTGSRFFRATILDEVTP